MRTIILPLLFVFAHLAVLAQNTGGIIIHEVGEIELDPPPGGNTGGTTNTANERDIYIIHGTGGNAEAMMPAENLIDAQSNPGQRWPQIRITEGYDYNDLASMQAGAQELRALIPSRQAQLAAGVNPDRSFLIGPSYGGLVARQLLLEYSAAERPFGGIVSFASPNEGSRAATNRRELVQASLALTSDLAKGPVIEFAEGKWWLSFQIDLPAGIPGIMAMVPGNPNLAALPDTDPAFPSIHIICEEERGDLVWRFMNSLPLNLSTGLQGANFNISNPRNLPDFTSNTDDPFLGDMINNEAHYLNRYQAWLRRKINTPNGSWYGGRHYSGRELESLRDSWRDGWVAIRTFDDVYKGINGFHVDTWGWIQAAGFCTCSTPYGGFTFPTANPFDCQNNGCPSGYHTLTQARRWDVINRVYLPNDGVVTAASQAGYGSFRVEQPGDDHFSKSNSAVHRDAMERILDGRSHPWFRSSQ